eukprot:397328-Pyramimonas_sp.AAC.1
MSRSTAFLVQAVVAQQAHKTALRPHLLAQRSELLLVDVIEAAVGEHAPPKVGVVLDEVATEV